MTHSIFIKLLLVGSIALLLQFWPKSAESECRSLKPGAPRGLMCLHCMYKKARGVKSYTDTLLNSCQRKVALAFITDGTFGYDESIILDNIDKITSAGRKLSLHLYIINGPAQRRYVVNTFTGFAVMSPGDYNRLLLNDSATQETFKTEVNKILPLIEYARNLGVRVSLSPALEDNFTDEAFEKSIDLIEEVIPKKLAVKLVRSPCPTCWLGNEGGIPDDIATEHHTKEPDFIFNNGIVSNDGIFFTFTWGDSSAAFNQKPKRLVSIKTIQNLQKYSNRLGNIFLLWVGKYQGNRTDLDLTPLASRTFAKPTKKELKEITKFLQGSIK